MRNVSVRTLEDTPRPVVAAGNDYPDAFELASHRHRRCQLLYASEGVVTVNTPQGAWAAPPERAVWIPAGVDHAVRMVGAVSTRSALITSEACPTRGDRCEVLAVSPLLRQLLVAAADIPAEYDEAGRDGLVMALLLAEVASAPVIPLAVPFPQSPALARRCHAFLERPDAQATIALDLGYDSPAAFATMFKRLTGIPPSRYQP